MSQVLNNFIGRSLFDEEIKIPIKVRGKETEEFILEKFDKTINNVVNKGIIFYGPTGSGKSILIRDFMHLTKKNFPTVFAFAPTNAEKHDYDKIIPEPLVYDKFGLKEIKEIYTRQRSMTEIYNNANDIKILKSLFDRIASPTYKEYLNKLIYLKNKALKEVNKQYESLSDKKQRKDEVEEIFKEKLITFFKQVIIPNTKKLEKMKLSQEERFALKYKYLNPKILIIFDDAFTEIMQLIKEGKKKNDDTIKNFFFKGRHANISHWYAFQDDTRMDSDIRRNALVNIFTDKQVALGYFNKTANSFTPDERNKASAIINVVFNEKLSPKHAKLVYSRLSKNKFYYIIGEEFEDDKVQMCSENLRNFCEKITSKTGNFDKTNPYFQKFQDLI